MRRAIYLDFSIPLFEKESNLRFFASSLKDLARYISKTKNAKFYVSFGLEFITTFKDEVSYLFDTFKTLAKDDRVEFIVRDSFDVNSLRYPRNVSDFNFIFNEYLLGYYFGERRNFEGDPAIMVKNLNNIFPFNGKLSLNNLEYLNGLGYSSFFLDRKFLGNSSFIYNSNNFTLSDFEFSSLFSGFLDKEQLDTYLLHTISCNYMVFYINPYNISLLNPDSFNLNFSNLFHLIDLTDKIEYRFSDEYFEMPVYKNLPSLNYDEDSYDISSFQADLSRNLKIDLPNNLDLTLFDDLKNVSLWDATGNRLIDEYLRMCFLILTLISNSVGSKINLLNKHLIAHLTLILDELEVYTLNNEEFKNSIKKYREFINQN